MYLRPLIAFAVLLSPVVAQDAPSSLDSIQVPAGYAVELAASSSLIRHPMMADFDDRGRLYVAASAGENLPRPDLEKKLPNFIRRLEDTNGDGIFDKATTFADRMTFPQGCLWLDGSLYVASSGAIWKLTDIDDDGVDNDSDSAAMDPFVCGDVDVDRAHRASLDGHRCRRRAGFGRGTLDR